MKKGMIFDLYQDNISTKRVIALNETQVMDLDSLEILEDIDFENEVSEILIENIFDI